MPRKKKEIVVAVARPLPAPLPPIPFNLPYVPLQLILNEVPHIEIFNLAFSSKSTRDLIANNFKKPVDSMQIYEKLSYFNVYIDLLGDKSLYFNFHRKPLEWEKNNKSFQPAKIWGMELRMRTDIDGEGYDFLFQSPSEMDTFLLKFVRFARTVFRTEGTILESRSVEKKHIAFSILKTFPFQKLNGIAIEWNTPSCINAVELQTLLDSADRLFVFVYLPNIKYRGPLNSTTLAVECASWLTIESLKVMKCKHLDAKGTMLTVEEINAFLQHWKHGGFPQDLKCCEFVPHRRFLIDQNNEEVMATLLEGLEASKGVPPRGIPSHEIFDPSYTWFFEMENENLITIELETFSLKFQSWNADHAG